MQLKTSLFEQESGWSRPLPTYDGENQLIIAFGSTEKEKVQPAISELIERFPESLMIGCSTSGEIHDAYIYDHSLSVAFLCFDKTAVRKANARVAQKDDSFAAGQALATQLYDDALRAVFILSDGLHVNGSSLVAGINDVLPRNVVVTGGLAGDGENFSETWVIDQGGLETGLVTAVGFYGDHIQVGFGSHGGWDIFGIERKVTRSDGSTLYEIDGKPALELYKTYLGDRSTELPASALLFPLSLRKDKSMDQPIVRTILSIDEEQQSMTFAGDIPQGSQVQLMKANFDRLIDGAMEAANQVDKRHHSSDTLSIAISCVGRRMVLGERAEEELEAVLEALPPKTQQVGFYSYGEITSYFDGFCELHNQTMTLTTISER